jgi:hypothetical protein
VASGVDITKDIIDLYDKTNPMAPGSSTPTTKPAATAPKPPAAAPPAATPVKKQP